MNQSNHTPGPWHTQGCTIYAAGNRIAQTWDTCDDFPTPEMEADARLIASAPDLLRALQRLMLEVESICAHEAGAMRDELIERLHKDWDGKILDSRLAISKAKGQE